MLSLVDAWKKVKPAGTNRQAHNGFALFAAMTALVFAGSCAYSGEMSGAAWAFRKNPWPGKRIDASGMSHGNQLRCAEKAVEQLWGFFLTFAVGSAGFFLFKLCRVPNPALLGSMVATGALSLLGHYPVFPVWAVSFIATAMVGVMVGKNLDRNILRRAGSLLLPVMVQFAGIFALSLLCGYTLYAMAGSGKISLMTALLAGTAGGIAEMLVFGVSANADVAVIALVQLFRVVVFNALLPYLSLIGKKISGGKSPAPERGLASLPAFGRREYIPLAACALAGAVLGRWSGIPSGGMLGAMLACGLVAIVLNKHYLFGRKLGYLAQIGLGMAMGARMTPEICGQLGNLLFPALVVTAEMLVGCALLAFLLRAITGWEATICLICAAPAGLSQSAVIAEESGVDPFTATVFHSVRIIGIVSLYPWIIMRFTAQ